MTAHLTIQAETQRPPTAKLEWPVLALTVALVARDRTSIVIAAAVQLTSLAALVSYIYNWPVPALVGAFLSGLAIVSIYREARANGARWPALRVNPSSVFTQARQS